MANQPSPRRRFQFRLRTLFVVTAIVAVWAWFTSIVPLAIDMHRIDPGPPVYEPDIFWLIVWMIVTGIAVAAIWTMMSRQRI
jgi:hypothetical protein